MEMTRCASISRPEPSLSAPRRIGPRAATWGDAYTEGEQTWPGLPLTFQQFATHVGMRSCREVPPPHAFELYLAAACTLGLGTAHRILEETYIRPLKGAVYHITRDGFIAEDVLQDLRKRLLVGNGKIASYRGLGSLRAWVRASAVNIALDRVRFETARRRISKALYGVEWASITGSYVDRPAREHGQQLLAFGAAMRNALSSLESSEKRLLHDYFVSGLSIDRLSPKYFANRSTIARRIQRITAGIRRRVRHHLASLYHSGNVASLDALAREAADCLEIDIAVLLATGLPDEPPG
jgi:RNA polymerase sigma-70 factor, ECF subfamily